MLTLYKKYMTFGHKKINDKTGKINYIKYENI